MACGAQTSFGRATRERNISSRRRGAGDGKSSPGVLVASGVERVAAALVGPLLLGRVARDQRPHEHRMRRAAHLVLDREERLRGFWIDDVLEPVLDRIRLLADEAAVLEPPV